MARRSLWAVVGAVLLGAAVAMPIATASAGTAAPKAPNPYGDPNLVSMFDGKTLNGWTSSKTGLWSVVGGAIHGNGTARGWIYYNKQVDTFRWIFNVRQVSGNHAPTVLIWGSIKAPLRDALDAIQFQPPNGGHWDYRKGHNNGGSKFFKQSMHPKIDIHKWAQCEIIANAKTGVAQMACCPLPAGAVTCKATLVLTFKDPKAGRLGPVAIQVHNKGIHDEYKSLFIESPVVMSPGKFITT